MVSKVLIPFAGKVAHQNKLVTGNKSQQQPAIASSIEIFKPQSVIASAHQWQANMMPVRFGQTNEVNHYKIKSLPVIWLNNALQNIMKIHGGTFQDLSLLDIVAEVLKDMSPYTYSPPPQTKMPYYKMLFDYMGKQYGIQFLDYPKLVDLTQKFRDEYHTYAPNQLHLLNNKEVTKLIVDMQAHTHLDPVPYTQKFLETLMQREIKDENGDVDTVSDYMKKLVDHLQNKQLPVEYAETGDTQGNIEHNPVKERNTAEEIDSPYQWKKLESSFPNLMKYAENLTLKAEKGELPTVVGRESDIAKAIGIIQNKRRPHPLILGESGSGKTTIAYGLAQKIAKGEVPEALKNAPVFNLDLSALNAGTKYRGDFESRFKVIFNEINAFARNGKKLILIIDECHMMNGLGSASGSANDFLNMIKPYLENTTSGLSVIGLTTHKDYKTHLENDPAIQRRCRRISISPLDKTSTRVVLAQLAQELEAERNVVIPHELVDQTVHLTRNYIQRSVMPGPAIDALGHAVDIAIQESTPGQAQQALDLQDQKQNLQIQAKYQQGVIERYQQEQEQSLKTGGRSLLFTPKKLRLAEKDLKAFQHQLQGVEAQLAKATQQVRPKLASGKVLVQEGDLRKAVSIASRVPLEASDKQRIKRILNAANELRQFIIGQDEACDTVANVIQDMEIKKDSRSEDDNKPVGSFLFVGPTGVGKTELTKTMARLFGYNFERFDMSEYMEKHSVARFIGSPPGYVGFERGGLLTEAVDKHPQSVVLLDEIEKAHPDVLNVLLQIQGDGRLQDGNGKNVSFKNTIVVLTSNLHHDQLYAKFKDYLTNTQKLKPEAADILLDKALRGVLRGPEGLRPELLNRVENVVYFKPLKAKDFGRIMDLITAKLNDGYQGKVKVSLTEEAKTAIINLLKEEDQAARKQGIGFTHDLQEKQSSPKEPDSVEISDGARSLERLFKKTIQQPINRQLLQIKLKHDGGAIPKMKITVDYDTQAKQFVFRRG